MINECFEPNETVIKQFATETNKYTITNRKIYIQQGANLVVMDIKRVNFIKYEPTVKKSPTISIVFLILFSIASIVLGVLQFNPSIPLMLQPILTIMFFPCLLAGIIFLIVVLVSVSHIPPKMLTIGISGRNVALTVMKTTEQEIAELIRLVFIAKNQLEVVQSNR